MRDLCKAKVLCTVEVFFVCTYRGYRVCHCACNVGFCTACTMSSEVAAVVYEKLPVAYRGKDHGSKHKEACFCKRRDVDERFEHIILLMYYIWRSHPQGVVRYPMCQHQSAGQFLLAAKSHRIDGINDLTMFADTYVFLHGTK